MDPMLRARPGIALVLVAGVLGVLALLCVSLVVLTRLERRAAQQRLHTTQAALLARSGVEDAVARLSSGQDPSQSASRYGGEDWNADGVENSVEPLNEVFAPSAFDVETCPVRHAMRSSFSRRDSFGAPDLVNLQGRLRGYSGLLNAGTYALKVEDESGKININGGFLDAVDRDDVNQDGLPEGDGIPDHRDPFVTAQAVPGLPAGANGIGRGWNAPLVRILNLLGNRPEIGVPNLGTLALQNRPVGGYRSVEALRQAVGGTKDLSPYLTVTSWIDPKVVHPNGYPGQPSAASLCDVKKNRQQLRLEEAGRPPVNLNAAPRIVLAGLIEGLSATEWFHQDIPATFVLPSGEADLVTNAIVQARPFDGWAEFQAFCDGLVPSVLAGSEAWATGDPKHGGNLATADLIKANFNPNTQLAKQIPDQLLWKWVDKSDLLAASTEGCLEPTGGFRVSCAARILDPAGRVLSEATHAASVEAFRPLTQTSQTDFVAGRPLTDYLSQASAPHRTTGASAAWGAGNGFAVITHPCAPMCLPGGAADIDGGVGLAPTELPPDHPGGATPGVLKFLHHFDDGWDADPPSVSPGRVAAPYGLDACLQSAVATGIWPAPPTEPGTLVPEGLLMQKSREPAFLASGNFPVSYTSADTIPTNHGVFSFWSKPLVTAWGADMSFSCVRRNALNQTEALVMAWSGDDWGILAENCPTQAGTSADSEHERYFRDAYDATWARLPGARWSLLTALFDTDQAYGEDVRADILAFTATSDSAESAYALNFRKPSEDLLGPGVVFAFGHQPDETSTIVYAHQVIDEFALLDFGDAAGGVSGSVVRSAAWAGERFKDGRYYKGDDGVFLSTELAPPGGLGRVLKTRWTEYLPRESRRERRVIYGSAPAPGGSPRLTDPRLADGPGGERRAWIEMELLEASGGFSGASLAPLRQGARVDRWLQGFRYRVRFRTSPADPMTGNPDPLNQPVLETPFLDDVTFYVQPGTGPRVLAWD